MSFRGAQKALGAAGGVSSAADAATSSTEFGDAARIPSARRLRLWAEFLVLFLGVPLLMAFGLPPSAMWTALAICLALSAVLLALTPGVKLRELWRGPAVPDLRVMAGLVLVTVTASFALVMALIPQALFWMPLRLPELWLSILVLYPLLSALPQEVVFRMLFFRRYGALFPSQGAAIAVNAAVFGLAHLFLWNWVAVAMTVAGGAIFSWAYLSGRGRNLLQPLLMHSLAGAVIFTMGLGRFFFHGAVTP